MSEAFSFEQVPDLLRLFASILSGLVALVPLWSHLGVSTRERYLIAFFVAVLVFLFWPVGISECEKIMTYWSATILLLSWVAFASASEMAIRRQFGYSQLRPDEEFVESPTVLGGPKLTPAASAMHALYPHMTIQQIFTAMNFDVLKTWDRASRTRVVVAHRSLVVTRALALMLAVVAAAASGVLRMKADQARSEFALDPSEPQTVLAGRTLDIKARMQECRLDIAWEIEGSPAAKEQGLLGQVSSRGTYSAPETIEREFDLEVVATLSQYPQEFKKVKIQLRRHPDYSTPIEAPGRDTENRQAMFVIEVLDDRHSWIIGQNQIKGVDGANLAQRMAAEGVFSGFQDIIAIGAASREYESQRHVDRRAQEERRARERAFVLGRWVRDAVGPGQIRVHALKVGRYNDEIELTAEETERERQVVIVGVLPGADENVDLLSAVRDAFERKRLAEPVLGMFLDHYPKENWELRRMPAR